MGNKILVETSSFRDPAGHVFYKGSKVYRQVNQQYRNDFEFFLDSGLYDSLKEKRLIVPFQKVAKSHAICPSAYAVLETPKISFISYPYEWSFSQLQDAAETTLTIQKIALEHGMSLKDASAFNIQFTAGKHLLIDVLSFEKYKKETPWVAYRQFCQHFLAPLALMSYRDVRLNQLLKTYLDGIPLDLASSLLPKKTWLNFSLASHIHLHAKTQKHFAKIPDNVKKRTVKMSKHSLLSIIDDLSSAVKKLRLALTTSQWGDYYASFSYSAEAFSHKKRIVSRFLDVLAPGIVWDLGANTGEFSYIAAKKGMELIAFDADFLTVEKNYRTVKKDHMERIIPLVVDFANPTPSLGWENRERQSLISRGPADCALSLALVHHLAIVNNVPFEKIAHFFSHIAHALIIEFVPKEDVQVKKLLSTREDIFLDYHQNAFEKAFSSFFEIVAVEKIHTSARIMYCMKKKNHD
ncbi:MAG TPA: SAM-dependent methyltransferase [Patescibacteria group bacterium]|nr:SAM-dependent methyltransferase [Patescibacteria group bacterium]